MSSTSIIAYVDKPVIDKYAIASLTEFTVTVGIRIYNQSGKTIYVKAVINDASGNWTFDDGTTEKQLGSVAGFSNTFFTPAIKRAVPTEDDVEESFTMLFEIYKDSAYTQKADTISAPVTVTIVDFRNSTTWTMDVHDTFDDGSAGDWTTQGVTDNASVIAGGYSIYNKTTSAGTVTKTSSKSVTLPSGVNKLALVFYTGYYVYSSTKWRKKGVKNLEVYINGEKVLDYDDWLIYQDGSYSLTKGWYQWGIDITEYAGQTVTIEIKHDVYIDSTVDSAQAWAYIDEFIIAHK